MLAMAACLVCGFEADPRAQPAPPPGPSAGGLCIRCGAPLPSRDEDQRRRPQRTILGGHVAPFSSDRSPPGNDLSRTAVMARPPGADDTSPGFAPLVDAHSATIVDPPRLENLKQTMPIDPRLAHPSPAAPTTGGAPSYGAPQAGAPASRAQGTLLGVARPGIAPLSASAPRVAESSGVHHGPSAAAKAPLPAYQPFEELGATAQVPRPIQREVQKELARAKLEAHPLGRRRMDRVPPPQAAPAKKQQVRSRRPLLLLGAATLVVVGAILAAAFWPRSLPIEAQVRAADAGNEVLDLQCSTCPDGTTVSWRGNDATFKSGRASLSLPAPLPIGDSTVKVAVDRPGNGRDEELKIPVRVAYRIRPDLATLEADAPSLQVVIEAMEGAQIVLDGEPVTLRDGRAVKTIDVRKDVTGADGDPAAQLTRKIAFTVKPPDGDEEKGVVAVAVPIVPLVVEAPGRATVTDKPNFYLQGRTTPGAEIVVAGRSIGVSRDGTFSQTMNVSSVGATEIEVRAKMAGRAPRVVRVGVERVADLRGAVKTFEKRGPITVNEATTAPAEARGKPIVVTGELLETSSVSGITSMIVRPTRPSCGDGCVVRLVQGRADLGYARGNVIRAFGFVNGSISHGGASIPDVDVAFSIEDRLVEDGPGSFR